MHIRFFNPQVCVFGGLENLMCISFFFAKYTKPPADSPTHNKSGAQDIMRITSPTSLPSFEDAPALQSCRQRLPPSFENTFAPPPNIENAFVPEF